MNILSTTLKQKIEKRRLLEREGQEKIEQEIKKQQ